MTHGCGKIYCRRDRLPTPVFLGFPGSSGGKESDGNVETWVRSLGWEDTLEKGIATHSSILAWKIPWTEEPDRLQSMGLQKSWIRLSNFHFSLSKEIESHAVIAADLQQPLREFREE